MKKFVALLLAAMMLLAMVACGNDPQPTPEPDPTPEPTVDTAVVDELYAAFDASMAEQLGETPAPNGEKIGAVIISLTNQFWANMKVCYEAAAEKLGVQIDVQTGTTEGDTQSQLDVLMTMADMDYDVIIVSPIDGTNLIPGIVKCNEKGIKVINLGPGVDTAALAEAGGHLDGKITVQFSDQGKIVANDMISRLPEGGEVAILQGLAGAGQSEGRTAGATAVFEATENIELVASIPCDWDATKAYDTTKDILTAHPDLKGIFACNDVMALAAVEALAAESRTDVLELKDLKPGMVLTGTVRNVIDFGVFVDIGVHQDGLVHISRVCDRYIKHPSEVLAVGDVVKVVVLEVDEKRKRISLSIRDVPKEQR